MKLSMTLWSRAMSFAAAAAVASSAAASAQTLPLGELAKKEEARRKGVTAPTKVLTNTDVPKKEPAPVPPGQTAAAAKPADEKTPPKPDEPVKDEAYWKGRMQQAREELRRNEM